MVEGIMSSVWTTWGVKFQCKIPVFKKGKEKKGASVPLEQKLAGNCPEVDCCS